MTHTGWRKPTPGLVVAEQHAQAGEGLSIPKSKAIVATKKIAAAIGLKAQDLLLLDTFGAVTQTQDWEKGRRPIVWVSNNFLMEQTGFSLPTLRRHVRRLCEAGLIWMKDSPNGKRWGRRDDDGYITEAYGFDLAPLAARTEEFERLYAHLQEERQFCASLRNMITISRRTIRAKIEKAIESDLRGPWRDLRQEFADMMLMLPKRAVASEKLLNYVERIKGLKTRVEDTFEAAFDWPEHSDKTSDAEENGEAGREESRGAEAGSTIVSFSMNPTPRSLKNETHILTTKHLDPVKSNRFEKKHVENPELENLPPERVERPHRADSEINWNSTGDANRSDRAGEVDIPMLMIACPHFAEMARMLEGGFVRNWNDLHRAAGQVRGIAGISEDAWTIANTVMGPERAAATVALIFDKQTNGEVKSAGGYLRGMVEKARNGELHLDRSFYGRLREAQPA